ncbi:MAG: hypothetical protein FWF52_11440 [Candidatus Azobacteroides sp.]|nr:hypothetical protein [Candidatus Azobacteroides sp.]
MKGDRYIYLLLVWFCIFPAHAKEAAPNDTFQIEAFPFDSTIYEKLKEEKEFNYYRQQDPNETNSLLSWRNQLYRWLEKHMNMKITEKQFNNIMLFFFLLMIVAAVVLLYFYKPSLFYFNRKQRGGHPLEEESIEGQDFEFLIRQALKKGDYTEAIRLNYLKVLKLLTERGLISFNPYKTVNEYVYELKRTDLKPDFRMLSQQFVYYRYGKRKASMETFEHFKELSRTIIQRFQ